MAYRCSFSGNPNGGEADRGNGLLWCCLTAKMSHKPQQQAKKKAAAA